LFLRVDTARDWGVALCILLPFSVLSATPREDPYRCLSIRGQSYSQARANIAEGYRFSRLTTAYQYCVMAELLKQAADLKAEDFYSKALKSAEREAAYEFFYGDYLRQYRGANRPLFQESEYHYRQALKKLADARNRGAYEAHDSETQLQVNRGLVTLYEQEGIPLYPLLAKESDDDREPRLFLASINEWGRSTTEIGSR
jgi:hypothetical protein